MTETCWFIEENKLKKDDPLFKYKIKDCPHRKFYRHDGGNYYRCDFFVNHACIEEFD